MRPWWSVNSADTSARIVSLRRYISLLNQEQKRLNWILASASATSAEHADAETSARMISEKLHRAEKELTDLEIKR